MTRDELPTDEQYVRREMARKARLIAKDLGWIVERILDQAKLLERDEAPDLEGVVDTLVKAVTQDVALATVEIRPIIGELWALGAIRAEEAAVLAAQGAP